MPRDHQVILPLYLVLVTWTASQCVSQPNIAGFLGSCNLTDQSLPGAEPYKVNTSFSCDYHGGNDSKLECNLTKEENVGCYFQACLIDNTTESCILYTLKNCSRNGSTSCADEETPADEGTNGGSSIFIAFLVIFVVALLVAGFVILTLALMIRDMKNERVQDNLPNPYSCLFSLMGSILTSPAENEEEKEKKTKKKKVKKEKKQKTPKETESAPTHYRRKNQIAETEAGEDESDDPEHDVDDYEEMEAADKRDSFLEGGPDDIYQNTD